MLDTRESRISRLRPPSTTGRVRAAEVHRRVDAGEAAGVDRAAAGIPGDLGGAAGLAAHEPHDLVARGLERRHERGADQPGCAGDDDLHAPDCGSHARSRHPGEASPAPGPRRRCRLPLAPRPGPLRRLVRRSREVVGMGAARRSSCPRRRSEARPSSRPRPCSSGGTALAAILAAVFLNARYVAMSIAVASIFPGGRRASLLESQLIVDESWALSGRSGRFEWPILVGAGRLPVRALGREHRPRDGRRRRARRPERRSGSTPRSPPSSSRWRSLPARAPALRPLRSPRRSRSPCCPSRRPASRSSPPRSRASWGSGDERRLDRRRGGRRRQRPLQGRRPGARRPASASGPRRARSRSSRR